MRPTIDDIAREVNVSTATVSRALRGLSNVAPETRQKILDRARELGYQLSPVATRTARGKKSVGIITPLKPQWFLSKLISSIESYLFAVGLEGHRFSIDSIDTRTDLIEQLVTTQLVDGLILTSTSLKAESIDRLAEIGSLKIVTIEGSTEYFSSVYIDNVEGAKIATSHLINLGHRSIGLISGEEYDPLYSPIPSQRKEGYVSALEEASIPVRKELITSGNFSYQGGEKAMEKLFTIKDPPTAIFALSDEMAIGAMYAIRKMKLRVPEDISVMGFDDNDVSKYIGLTSVHQPVSEFGEQAAKQLVYELYHDIEELKHIELGFNLIIRETTGPGPGRKSNVAGNDFSNDIYL